jgi:hypothetical protein
LPGLVLNCDLPDLLLLSSKDNRCEPLCLASVFFLCMFKDDIIYLSLSICRRWVPGPLASQIPKSMDAIVLHIK